MPSHARLLSTHAELENQDVRCYATNGEFMNWSLFCMSTALWVFFFEHFVWLKRFEAMAEHGLHIPSAISSMSKTLTMVTMFNLLAFLLVFGFKISWLWSVAIVVGGYVAALALAFITRGSQGTLLHKIGWFAMPILSIGIWVAAFMA